MSTPLIKRAWSNYKIAAQLKDPENPGRNKERRAATLLTCIDSDALDVINAMEFENEDQRKDPEVILEKMKQYCIGECNETYERYVFNRRDQESNESVDAYVTVLRKLAKTCNYGPLTDSLIRNRMVVGINDNSARKKLLQTSKLTLGQCIDICRSSQTLARQLKEMNQEDVCFVKEDKKKTVDKKKTKVPEKSASASASFVPGTILSLRRTALYGDPLARIVASQTILRYVARNRRKKCCLWITHPRMRSMNMWPRLK